MALARIRMAKPLLATIDTRLVKPPPKTADADLQTPEHRQWAEGVKRHAGYRCEVILPDGRRCPKAAPGHRLFADHIKERRDDGDLLDPRNGQCLCGQHHSLKTAAQPAERMRS